MIESTMLTISSAELAATEEHPFLVTRIPDAERVGPNIQFVLNNQGVILNATFTSQRTSDAERIGRFIADHNGQMAELRVNSRLGDLK